MNVTPTVNVTLVNAADGAEALNEAATISEALESNNYNVTRSAITVENGEFVASLELRVHDRKLADAHAHTLLGIMRGLDYATEDDCLVLSFVTDYAPGDLPSQPAEDEEEEENA